MAASIPGGGGTVMQSYLSLVPRGLHWTVREMIIEKLSAWEVKKVDFVGECAEESDADAFVKRVTDELHEADQRGNKGRGNKSHRKDITTATCRLPVGCAPSNVSLGYSRGNEPVWSGQGLLQGVVWMKIATTAPISILANSIRCLGPLLALVDVWEDVKMDESQSLEEAVAYLGQKAEASNYSLGPALDLWKRHVKAAWPLSDDEQAEIVEKLEGRKPLRYRLSCIRTDSKSQSYSRQELLRSVADIFAPVPTHGEKWIVDLVNYDVEVVLLVRPHSFAVGLALRPYRQVGAKSCSSGTIPPDISPPYLSGEVLSGLVRLRPSTANILLHLAQVKAGDVVVDPCAGIGTIPLEALLFGPSPVVALGGDLALTSQGLSSIAANYSKEASIIQRGLESAPSSVANFMAFDAGNIPIRTGVVDAVVSDLPFGQRCLSTAKLTNLLPLIMGECARMLRPGTGHMVLLCGAYAPILESLLETNGANDDIWELPCAAVFPVNIGGLLAWIVQVRRGKGVVDRSQKHVDRVRKLTRKREEVARMQKGDADLKRRRQQS
jgi:hypothetical protein